VEHIKKKIDQVMLKLETGKITEDEAHIAIAEITTSIPPEDILSQGVKDFVAAEINGMDISDNDKQLLRDTLEEES